MMYRKDLFEDPKEKAAFKAKYGRELEVPQTYSDAKQVAEFFTRPDQGLFGWGQMGGRPYDFATSASNPFLGPMAANFGTRKLTRSRVISTLPPQFRGCRPMSTCSNMGPREARPGTGMR